MAQRRKESTSTAKRNTPRRGTRKGGETAITACTCEIDLKDDDPIVSFSVSGGSGGYFKGQFAKGPACTPTPDCRATTTYQWTLVSATPAQPGGQAPKFDGETTNPNCHVINAGKIKLKLEVRLECARRGEGGVDRLSECSDTGEATFRIN